MPIPSIHKSTIPGKMVKRGFWLYVWRAQTLKGERLYVGRTGDVSSPYATAPYTRMGQHLGFNKSSNSLRRLLKEQGIDPEDCKNHEIISYGPIYSEIAFKKGQDRKNKDHRKEQFEKHKPFRDKVAAMEKKLYESLDDEYSVLNKVRSNMEYDKNVWKKARLAFLEYFPKMK